ncbi:uncharacterized protein LOC105204738 [Solenopsis invicta]|uniref:uncharacterized protein LOC105204738 n=1 Tax=Solenopsis invicta TaxID=13686 RepID=UPI000595B487|nr:uncharacterized protein LOC105204738 [Solenopsis invicta]
MNNSKKQLLVKEFHTPAKRNFPKRIQLAKTSYYRTIVLRPINVTSAIAEKLLSTVYSRIKIAAPARFKVNESVRVSKFKTIFNKDYTPNWTTEIFTIAKVQRTNPITYLLKNSCRKHIAGGFYEYELQRVANPDLYFVEKILHKRGNEVYVK